MSVRKNEANKIASIGGSSSYVDVYNNGNMTKVPKLDNWSAAFTCVYDAWNRLVEVRDSSNTLLASYIYNGLNQRVRKVTSSETRLYYFNRRWQCLEEYVGSTLDTTYIWGKRYIDDLVCRDRSSERLYSLSDANWNVVALTDASGVVKERMTYSAFGRPNWLSAAFGSKSASSYDWTRTFTGQVLDSETGLMLYRNRYYHTGLGRFVTRDPIGYGAGDVSLYRYVNSNPLKSGDVFGLMCEDELDIGSRWELADDTVFAAGTNKPGIWEQKLSAAQLGTRLFDIAQLLPTGSVMNMRGLLNWLSSAVANKSMGASNTTKIRSLLETLKNFDAQLLYSGGFVSVWIPEVSCYECMKPCGLYAILGGKKPQVNTTKKKWVLCELTKIQWNMIPSGTIGGGEQAPGSKSTDEPVAGKKVSTLAFADLTKDDIEKINKQCKEQAEASCWK